MKKLCALFAAAVACTLLPSAANAVCSAAGTIVETKVTGVGAYISVRANYANATTYVFSTNSVFLTAAALAAQSSHMNVRVDGTAAACGVVAAGQSTAGPTSQIEVSP